jgi:hypothetical protein
VYLSQTLDPVPVQATSVVDPDLIWSDPEHSGKVESKADIFLLSRPIRRGFDTYFLTLQHGQITWFSVMDPIPEGKNYPEKYKTVNKFHLL